jgi:hypothetical protein
MLSALILVAFIKLSIYYNNPLILAGGYTLVNTLIVTMLGIPIDMIIVSTILTLSVSWLFFWLLDRFEESSFWWGIVIFFPSLVFILSRIVS